MTSILTKSVSACLALHVALVMWAQTLSHTLV
jgi:hypothetical protein